MPFYLHPFPEMSTENPLTPDWSKCTWKSQAGASADVSQEPTDLDSGTIK